MALDASCLVRHPDGRLRRRAEPVVRFDASLKELAEEMMAAMVALSGVGLAANQLGNPLRIFVSVLDGGLVCVNPMIVSSGGSQYPDEGCLSVPGRWYHPHRPAHLELSYQDLDGTHHHLRADGFAAQLVSHEVDHLDGVLLFDRVEPEIDE
jgi:peptide deformylase